MRKNIRDCVDIVLYIGLPVSFCLFVFAKPLYAILFPPANPKDLALLAQILSWFSIEAFLNTIAPVFTALLMSVGLRRLNIRNLAIMVVVKFAVAYPLLMVFGYPGIVMSSILAMGIFIALDMIALTTRYQVRWKYTLHKLCVIVLAMLALYGVALGCSAIGLKGYGSGRMMSLFQLAVSGSLSVLVYFAITYGFGIPQSVLHLDLGKLWRKVKR